MGLDTTHDAFSGAYSSFNRFRKAVAQAVGASYPPHDKGATDGDGNLLDPNMWYIETEEYNEESHPGLFAFLSHSDCDGDFSPEECVQVANDLEPLVPALDTMGEGGGHIAREGGYGGVIRKFIAGCRAAAAANEPLEFF